MAQTASDHLPQSPARAPSRPLHLSWLDRLTLVALVSAIVLVTIPRLRAMAIQANERDAQTLLEWLGRELGREAEGAIAGSQLADYLGSRPEARRLEDARLLENGLLQHHGYLFSYASDGAAQTLVWAWPEQAGRTGKRAFAWAAEGALEHDNPAGLWSGEQQPAPNPRLQAEGWRSLR